MESPRKRMRWMSWRESGSAEVGIVKRRAQSAMREMGSTKFEARSTREIRNMKSESKTQFVARASSPCWLARDEGASDPVISNSTGWKPVPQIAHSENQRHGLVAHATAELTRRGGDRR